MTLAARMAALSVRVFTAHDCAAVPLSDLARHRVVAEGWRPSEQVVRAPLGKCLVETQVLVVLLSSICGAGVV
jgi:hypothetical protein